MAELGKRYRCENCGNEVLVVKAGEGGLQCCGRDMVLPDPKPIPSAD